MTQAIATRTATEILDAPEITSADQHPAAVYLGRLGKRSRRVMGLALDVIAGIVSGGALDRVTLPWHGLRYQHTAAIRQALVERYAPATVNRHLAALRGVLKEAWKLGLMSAEYYHRAAELAPAKGETLPAGRMVPDGEIIALFAACAADTTPAGARDAALLTVLFGAGLRRSEALGLDVADYDVESGEIRVRRGKGNKDRLVYATNGGRLALELWLTTRGNEAGPLLCPVNKGGRVTLRRMTGNAVTGAVRKRATQASVTNLSPHDFRRTYISLLLDKGADISTVQQLAGHADVTTTQRYDRRGEEVKRKAAELIHVPFVPQAAGE